MKKAIVLSVSMGVLGFSAPLVSEQVARAEVVAISNTNIQEVKIVPKLRVKDVRGSETILKANQTFIVPVDLSQTRRVAVPAIEHYMPKDKELVVTPLAVNGLFANYVADKAVVTVHYQDEQGKQIQKDIAFDNGTIFGNYKLKSKEYKIPGYELINTEAINGEIKSTDWDVNLIYRNLNPILQPENPVNPVQLIIPDVKQSEKATVEPALPAPEVKSIPEVPAAERQSAKKTTLTTKTQPVAVSPAPATPKLIEPEKSIVPEVSVTPQMPVAPKLETKEQVTIPDKPTVIDPKAEATAPTTLKEKSTVPEQQVVTTRPEKSDGSSKTTKEATTQNTTNPITTTIVNPAVQTKTTAEREAAKSQSAEKGQPDTKETQTVKEGQNQTESPASSGNSNVNDGGEIKKTVGEAKEGVPASPKVGETTVTTSKVDGKELTDAINKTKESTEDQASKVKEAAKNDISTYQLRGLDTHGNQLFNKTLKLSKDEAAKFRNKNIEYYGYDWVSTDFDDQSKVLTLHYAAKKVKFNIINVDETGHVLSKNQVELDFGTSQSFAARHIPGYQAKQADKVLKADNLVPSDVEMVYTKLPETISRQSVEVPTKGEQHAATTTNKAVDDKATLKTKTADKPKNARHHAAVVHDDDQPDLKDKQTASGDEKLPQTGESKSILSVLAGVGILLVMAMKKGFKRFI